jgi:hypothetical protein
MDPSSSLLSRLKKSYSNKSIMEAPKSKFKGYTNKNLVLPKKLQVATDTPKASQK